MEELQDIRTGRHCTFKLHAHLVFVTKYRRNVLDASAIETLRPIFEKVCVSMGVILHEVDGEDDHTHLHVEFPPSLALSKLVNSLKGVSSRMLRQVRPDIAKRYWKEVLWSPSYYAGSVGGAPIETLRRYIEQQRQKPARHRGEPA